MNKFKNFTIRLFFFILGAFIYWILGKFVFLPLAEAAEPTFGSFGKSIIIIIWGLWSFIVLIFLLIADLPEYNYNKEGWWKWFFYVLIAPIYLIKNAIKNNE